jgi:hypothetical protein
MKVIRAEAACTNSILQIVTYIVIRIAILIMRYYNRNIRNFWVYIYLTNCL